MAFAGKQMMTYEYIRGLVEGEGCFSFCQGYKKYQGGKYKLPTFEIAMHERDQELLIKVKDRLGLRNKIYNYPPAKNALSKGRKAVLIVREFDQLKDIIIPLFYKKLHGHKAKQFAEWLEKIGSDPDISNRFKSLYRLHKWGIYNKSPFSEKYL